MVVFAVKVNIPDVNNGAITTTNTNNEYIFSTFFSVLNKYLWYFIITIVFALVIYAGVILIKSEWTEEDIKKVKNIFKAIAIWIFLAILSGLFVKLIINLFS